MPSEQDERVLANPEFLGLGLDKTCRIWVRLQANLKKIRADGRGRCYDLFLPLESSTAQFPKSVVARTRVTAAEIDFTPEDERPFYGMELAFRGLYPDRVQSSPAAGKILGELVERPSLWSTLTHLGIEGKRDGAAAGDTSDRSESMAYPLAGLSGFPSDFLAQRAARAR